MKQQTCAEGGFRPCRKAKLLRCQLLKRPVPLEAKPRGGVVSRSRFDLGSLVKQKVLKLKEEAELGLHFLDKLLWVVF